MLGNTPDDELDQYVAIVYDLGYIWEEGAIATVLPPEVQELQGESIKGKPGMLATKILFQRKQNQLVKKILTF